MQSRGLALSRLSLTGIPDSPAWQDPRSPRSLDSPWPSSCGVFLLRPRPRNRHAGYDALPFLGLAEAWRLGQGEKDQLLAGRRADVVVQAQHLDAGDLPDHRLHERPG